MIYHDSHLHTEYSTDSHTPMEQQLNGAIANGLMGVCITDHMDYDFPPEAIEHPCEGTPFVFDEIKYMSEIETLRKKYPKLEIAAGVECGLQNTESVIEKNKTLVSNPNLDFVIGSLHLIDKMDPYYDSFWEGKKPNECIRQYFQQMAVNLTAFHGFDTLGHLDYIVRYAPDSFIYEPRDYAEEIDTILHYIIRHDIALEINTSGMKSSPASNPPEWVWKRYLSLGGELFTIGSDAHTPEFIGFHFSEIEMRMKKAGIRQYVTYHRHKPLFHDL